MWAQSGRCDLLIGCSKPDSIISRHWPGHKIPEACPGALDTVKYTDGASGVRRTPAADLLQLTGFGKTTIANIPTIATLELRRLKAIFLTLVSPY